MHRVLSYVWPFGHTSPAWHDTQSPGTLHVLCAHTVPAGQASSAMLEGHLGHGTALPLASAVGTHCVP